MTNLTAYRHINWAVVACAVAIVLIGLSFIYSALYQPGRDDDGMLYVRRQAVWAVCGFVVAALLVIVDYRRISSAAYFIYLACIILLVAVLFTSDPRRGARSWFSLGSFGVQPSEFAKIALILALAKYLSREEIPRSSAAYLLGALLIAAVPALLILRQPDLGTAVVLAPVILSMLVVARASGFYLSALISGGLLLLPIGWLLLKPYQQNRIRVFFNPHIDPLRSGYNAIQSFIAIGSGGLWGQGWLHGTQTHLRFLPERHTDFIFCVLAEETGFAGSLLLIVLYLILVMNGLRIAEQARDEFGRLAAVGITVLIASHAAINIGMTAGLLPITGLPLPLMSYGGSSLISMCICLGILESICARRYIF